MHCMHEVRMHRRIDQPIDQFLKSFHILRQLAGQSQMSPEEYIANGFVARVLPGEGFEEWLCRQVQEILETSLLDDNYEDNTAGRVTGTLHQAIRSVRLTPTDREHVIRTFGSMPGVRSLWRGLPQDQCVAA